MIVRSRQGERCGKRYPPRLFHGLEWRNIGPFQGGRVTAVAGHADLPLVYFLGAAGGGIWKTEDAGIRWSNVSDGHLATGSVGALAVAASDPAVIYAGMGEAQIRGTAISHGDGVYSSTDGGETWKHLGLAPTRRIARIQVHPERPEVVYAAAQGDSWIPSKARGVYRSLDAGKTWKRMLSVDERTGACDLAIDPVDPLVLYACFWEHRRRPWKIVSGGPGSGLYKTTDGGETWTRLRRGLPALMGKVGVAVCPARSERIWCLAEAQDGGLFRSDDYGRTFERVNSDFILLSRAWYYIKIHADPLDPDTVYVLNDPMLRSADGGRTFEQIPTPHSDHHDLWIDPDDPQRMVCGNDGGATVSFDGGRSWSTQQNQPTGQIYRVIADNRFPYTVYGGQQDHLTVAIPSRAKGPGIGRQHWYPVGGCENSSIALDPRSASRVYASSCHGMLTEHDAATDEIRNIMPYPCLGLGTAPRDLKYRFNWNSPVHVSPHDPDLLYYAGNVLLSTRDRGVSWRVISPDLTRDEPEKQGAGGGPITNEGAGAEVYNTILDLVESPHEPGTIWVGSDDGLVHLTRNGGETWRAVTPAALGEARINAIEASPHDPGTVFLAVTRHKLGDMTPLVFKTEDYGASWKGIVSALPDELITRVVREDPSRKGLLYLGTDTGLYLSFDAGERWQVFQLTLPIVPITDLTVHNRDLIASTQGRGFWILDDLTPLHQLDDAVVRADLHLFQPRATVRATFDNGDSLPADMGANPPNGVVIAYTLSEGLAKQLASSEQPGLEVEIFDSQERAVRSFPEKPDEAPPPAQPGQNRMVWDLRCNEVTQPSGPRLLPASTAYRVAPGSYRVRIRAGSRTATQTVEVPPDPRVPYSARAFEEQQCLLRTIWLRIEQLNVSVSIVRRTKEQIEGLLEQAADLPQNDRLVDAGRRLVDALVAWDEAVVQPRRVIDQDFIRLPNLLHAQLMYLLRVVDEAGPPVTRGAFERSADLEAELAERVGRLRDVLEGGGGELDSLARPHGLSFTIETI